MIDYIDQQADDIESLQEELAEYKQKLDDHSKDTEVLKRLYENGNIDMDWEPTNKYNENV